MRLFIIHIIAGLLISCQASFAQDQEYADSLISLYITGNFQGEKGLELLNEIAISHPEPAVMMAYSKELIQLADSLGEIEYLIDGYMAQGVAQRLLGQYFESLNSYINGYEIADSAKLEMRAGMVAVNLADLYSTVSDHESAKRYYREGIKVLRQENDSVTLASTLFNFGDEYYKEENMDSALVFYEESIRIFNKKDIQIGVAYNLGSIGQVKFRLGQLKRAEKDLKQAIAMLDDLGDLYGKSVYLLDLARIYIAYDELDSALQCGNESMELAKSFELVEQISQANLLLSEVYSEMGQFERSMRHYKDHVETKDSINSYLSIGNLFSRFEVKQKQAEVDLLKKEAQVAEMRGKRQQLGIAVTGLTLILVALLGINTYRRFQFARKTNKIIEEEKNRSEDLLLNILPRETANELREKGAVKARKIEHVTVLFTDFIEFTRHAEKETPEQMVRSIDYYFKQFDEITTRYNLEKIKTIGDSYMCAGGLHSEECRAKEVITAALEMQEVVERTKKSNDDLIHFDMRIGVHTGPVVAGIVGNKKWQFDIWGDTVNIASGVEAKSPSGRVTMSQTTYKEVKDIFKTEFLGETRIKNSRKIKLYFVT